MLTFFKVVNAQKVANIESGGKLVICNITSGNQTENCHTVESSGVTVANIGKDKVAYICNGRVIVCNIVSGNQTETCHTIEYSGVSNVLLVGDSKVIITYDSGKKVACGLDNSNVPTNCSTL